MDISEAKETLWYHINSNASSELSNDCEDEINRAIDAIISEAVTRSVNKIKRHIANGLEEPNQ